MASGTSATAAAQAVSLGGSATASAQAVATFDAKKLHQDLTCNCPAAQEAARAVAQAIAAAGGDCGCPAGKALAGEGVSRV